MPYTILDDASGIFRREVFLNLAKEGLTSLLIPKKFGGQEQSYRCHFACLEELARYSVSQATVVAVTNLAQGAICTFGTETQQKTYLPRFTSGELLGAFSLSEPGSGSDAAALSLAAKRAPGGYLLNGMKAWCTNGGVADLYLMFVRTAPHKTKGITAFLIEKEFKGFHAGKEEKKLGVRSSTLAQLILEDCFVPEENRLGAEGEGFHIALGTLDTGRLGMAAVGAGVTTEAIERTWRFRTQQEKLGQAFDRGEREILTDHFAQLQAVKGVIDAAALLKDQQKPITLLASQAKLLSTDLAMKTTSDALTLMGPAGYCRDLEVERMFRDAKALQIVEGTNQVQRVILARQLEEMMST